MDLSAGWLVARLPGHAGYAGQVQVRFASGPGAGGRRIDFYFVIGSADAFRVRAPGARTAAGPTEVRPRQSRGGGGLPRPGKLETRLGKQSRMLSLQPQSPAIYQGQLRPL